MALPKKKISLSRKYIRFNSKKLNKKIYTFCEKCNQLTVLHRNCFCSLNKKVSTNILKDYTF